MGSLLHTAARLELSATQALIRPLNHASGIDDSPPPVTPKFPVRVANGK